MMTSPQVSWLFFKARATSISRSIRKERATRKNSQPAAAILQAAVREIAEAGLGAPTAKIARRAGLAAGTLFTYFANKEKLLNELYLELKIEVYRRVDTNFPRKANLERRARHA